MDKKDVLSRFIDIYGDSGGEIRLYHSPGRVNLIGEHTDYNGGFVFPCALSFGTYGAARKRDDNIINLASANFELKITCSLDNIVFDEAHDWGNYPKGVIRQLLDADFGGRISGADIFVAGNIPNGAGLSSSASLELLMFVIYNDLFLLDIKPENMAKMAQKAENEFIGVNCGIMDQFIIAMGKKDNAVMLDCMKMEYTYVPVVLDGYKIIIANTNKRRGLADSKYNERRSECEAAVNDLRKELDINFLGDISEKEFEKYSYLIENETVRKRAGHVVYENGRVCEAVTKLKENDITAFGLLMNKSHDSLRDLYEVTGIELDMLVEEARKINGVAGSRMTGAGFGGCTVSIVKDENVNEFIKVVGENYKNLTGLTADFYIADTGDGAKRI